MNVHLWGGGGMWQYMNCLDVHVFPSHDVYLLSLTLEICKIMSHHDFEAELSAEVFNARALALCLGAHYVTHISNSTRPLEGLAAEPYHLTPHSNTIRFHHWQAATNHSNQKLDL